MSENTTRPFIPVCLICQPSVSAAACMSADGHGPHIWGTSLPVHWYPSLPAGEVICGGIIRTAWTFCWLCLSSLLGLSMSLHTQNTECSFKATIRIIWQLSGLVFTNLLICAPGIPTLINPCDYSVCSKRRYAWEKLAFPAQISWETVRPSVR